MSFTIDKSQGPSTSLKLGEIMCENDSMGEFTVEEVGGKAYNLHKLKDFLIPGWFAVPASRFESFLSDNKILPLIHELEILCKNGNERSVRMQAEKIQNAILQGVIDLKTQKEILFFFDKLKQKTNASHFAVRSSGAMEDAANSSCAGLYDTVLNLRNEEEILKGIKQVWASSFNMRIINERIRLGINQHQCRMGVIIQELINAEAAGVISTIVLGNNYPGMQITANYGMGVSVVDGEISPDSWVLHQTQDYILESFLGTKENKVSLRSAEGTETISVDAQLRNRFCLDSKEIKEIKSTVEDIKKLYKCELDIEFAIGPNRKIYILQARPLVALKSETRVLDPEDLRDRSPVARGNYSVPGVASGKAVFISNWEELASGKTVLTQDDIVIAYVTTNTWSQHLSNIKGLVTCEGSPSSHPILLCREKGVPCVIGMEAESFKKLIALNGQDITIDGHNRQIYSGIVATKKAGLEDLRSRFKTIEIRSWPKLDDLLPSLLHNKMVIEKDGKYWRKTPTFPIVGFQAEFNLNRFNYVGDLLKKPHIKIEARQIDKFVCSRMAPYEEYVALFNGMTCEAVKDFHQAQRRCMEEYLEISKQFELDSSVWKKYIELSSKLRAYIWLGGGLRSYTERKVDELGISLDLPAYYLDECAIALQSEMPELDTEMHQEVYNLAKEMVAADHRVTEDVSQLKQSDPGVYDKIEALAKKYRFEHQISLHVPTDLNVAYKRVLTEMQHIRSNHQFSSNKTSCKRRQLLPDTPLQQWLYLSIENRLLQSDGHHIDSRSKAFVRPKLLELGSRLVAKGTLQQEEDVFNASIDEITAYMEGL